MYGIWNHQKPKLTALTTFLALGDLSVLCDFSVCVALMLVLLLVTAHLPPLQHFFFSLWFFFILRVFCAPQLATQSLIVGIDDCLDVQLLNSIADSYLLPFVLTNR